MYNTTVTSILLIRPLNKRAYWVPLDGMRYMKQVLNELSKSLRLVPNMISFYGKLVYFNEFPGVNVTILTSTNYVRIIVCKCAQYFKLFVFVALVFHETFTSFLVQ